MLKLGKSYTYSNGPVGGPLTKFRVHQANQCRAKEGFLGPEGRCQGVQGHKGMHWFYEPNGWLYQWKSKKDIKGQFDVASSHCPPGSKNYIHPKDQEDWISFNTREVIGTEEAEPIPKKVQKILKKFHKHQGRKK